MWQSWTGRKLPLCKWHTFWMATYLICYFIVILLRESEKIVEFRRTSIKWKIVKYFTRLRAASRKLFSLHQPTIPPDEILLHLWNKNFFRELYRNIQIFAFKAHQESSPSASGNGAGQMIFLAPNRNIFAGKFVN